MNHILKTHPEYFQAIAQGLKTFDIRKNDRNFNPLDELILKEYNPATEQFTGAFVTVRVMYIMYGGQFGLEKGFVAMGIKLVTI